MPHKRTFLFFTPGKAMTGYAALASKKNFSLKWISFYFCDHQHHVLDGRFPDLTFLVPDLCQVDLNFFSGNVFFFAPKRCDTHLVPGI